MSPIISNNRSEERKALKRKPKVEAGREVNERGGRRRRMVR
jgi:hypothetical protein